MKLHGIQYGDGKEKNVYMLVTFFACEWMRTYQKCTSVYLKKGKVWNEINLSSF